MTVQIELFGMLRKGREKELDLKIDPPKTVAEIAQLVGIKTEEIGMAAIDGRQVPLSVVVPESCRLSLFPPMMGG